MWRSFSCICRMRLWILVGDSESDEMPSSVSHWKTNGQASWFIRNRQFNSGEQSTNACYRKQWSQLLNAHKLALSWTTKRNNKSINLIKVQANIANMASDRYHAISKFQLTSVWLNRFLWVIIVFLLPRCEWNKNFKNRNPSSSKPAFSTNPSHHLPYSELPSQASSLPASAVLTGFTFSCTTFHLFTISFSPSSISQSWELKSSDLTRLYQPPTSIILYCFILFIMKIVHRVQVKRKQIQTKKDTKIQTHT